MGIEMKAGLSADYLNHSPIRADQILRSHGGFVFPDHAQKAWFFVFATNTGIVSAMTW